MIHAEPVSLYALAIILVALVFDFRNAPPDADDSVVSLKTTGGRPC